MKYCSGCKQFKPETEFTSNKRKKDGLQSWCRQCMIANVKANRKKENYTRQRREKVWELKKPCQKCGDDRLYLIHFHHINPSERDFPVSSFRKHSLEKCKQEVKKCVCLCANCHTEYHFIYGQKPQNPVESLAEYLQNTERMIENGN